ncbi:NAD(P)-binding domain-containing protein, partial [Vibrio campbellii]
QADVVVLAVKPQMMSLVGEGLREVDFTNKLVISIAAGINCQRLEEMLGSKLTLVRVMPNTPSLVGEGMSGIYAPQTVSQEQRDFAH